MLFIIFTEISLSIFTLICAERNTGKEREKVEVEKENTIDEDDDVENAKDTEANKVESPHKIRVKFTSNEASNKPTISKCEVLVLCGLY